MRSEPKRKPIVRVRPHSYQPSKAELDDDKTTKSRHMKDIPEERGRLASKRSVVNTVSSRHQPSKAELDEPIHLPGRSPEHVARIVMQGGARRREPGNTGS